MHQVGSITSKQDFVCEEIEYGVTGHTAEDRNVK
jgi:hypothetical protein